MKIILKNLFISLFSTSLLLASSVATAKQIEIGIAAVATDATLVGKGEFVVNDTLDEGDSLKTGDKGSTTILFNDESMLTLGPNAHVSVEVYEESKNGKPGRSIIRIHKGQFRYFPGAILENGGSQFVAVGNKLLGKSATPNRRQPTNNQNDSSNTGNRNAAERAPAEESNGERNGRPQPVLASSTEGSGDGEQNGGTTGGINGPPSERNNQQAAAAGGVMSNPSSSAEGSDSDSSDTGGGISGFVGDSASDAGTMTADGSPSEDGDSSSASGSTEPLVAAADPEASSDSSSDSSDSSSTTTADSSSTSDSTSSSGTSSDTSSDVSTSDTRTGVNNAARAVNIVVAIGGSSGGAGTGGAGGGNQDCGEDCGNSGGGIVLPGGTPGGGLGTPGETGGIGGGFGGPGTGIGGNAPGLPSNGGSNPDVFGGGLAGGTRTPIGGNIGGFIESGISGNVLAGKGSFRGNVDVFGSSGADVGFLGSVSTDRGIGLDLGSQVGLTGKGLSNNIGANAALLNGGGKLDSTLGNVASSSGRFSAVGIDNSGLAGKFDASAVEFNNQISGATFDSSAIKLDNPASEVSFDTSSIKIETQITGVDTSSLRIQAPDISGGNKFNFGNTFRGGGGQFQSIPKELK